MNNASDAESTPKGHCTTEKASASALERLFLNPGRTKKKCKKKKGSSNSLGAAAAPKRR